MILTLDIGNTTVGVSGVEAQGADYRVLFSGKLFSREKGDDVFSGLKALLEEKGVFPEAVEGIALSSVVPRLDEPVSLAAEALLGRRPVRIDAASAAGGLSFAVPQPERLGLDRVAGAAWAARRYPLPAVTADLGTATTFNVIGEGGVFLGGVIACGVETGVRALAERTAQLPLPEMAVPESLIGRDTEACMRSGAVYGAAAMTDGIAGRVEAELGKPVTLILTGGWSGLAEPLCVHPHIWEPDLLPKGLALLYRLRCR